MGNISNIGSKFDQRTYVTGTTETRPVGAGEGQPTEKSADLTMPDKVSLSKESQDIQHAKEAVAAIPDIRADKVEPIKQQVNEGTYNVNAEKVAEKIIGSQISEVV